jgi:ATP-dependent helicase/nuclease subunit A
MSQLTPQQSAAVHGSGNILLVAGAGTGKTHTLTARCLRLILEERVSVANLLMVTFTEAAAAEMRERLRKELQQAADASASHAPAQAEWVAEQLALLDTAHIGTLHSFCLQLAREHFHELSLDPQFTILDETQTRPLQRAALDALLERHYAGTDETSSAVRELIRVVGRGADGAIRSLILKLHAFAQSLPNPPDWLDTQAKRFANTEPTEWRQHFALATAQLRDEWAAAVQADRGQTTALRLCADALNSLPTTPDYSAANQTIRAISAADIDENWPRGTKGKFRDPLKKFFAEAEFLGALLPEGERDPIAEDWNWARVPMLALIELVREFSADFAARKREFGGVDFADLEQCALRLLRDDTIATHWRERLAHVFVDEYQDINAAQDAILTTLSRSGANGNRFLVGDVKQSIYRFRLANPHIFQSYQAKWRKQINGNALSLTENFRSREAIVDFINPLFAALMRPEIGGVGYEPLVFGAPEQRAPQRNQGPRVEFHLIAATDAADETTSPDDSDENPNITAPDLQTTEREARLIAQRFRQLMADKLQVWDKDAKALHDVKWSDMAVLLRSPRGRAEAFAKEFNRLGIPLNAARDGFFTSLEVSDLLNLLRLLDNPLQDIPLAAVLRSPLVGLTMDELVAVRLAHRSDLLWPALNRAARHDETPAELRSKITAFLAQFQRWRELARQTSLSQTLETAIHETHYEPLLRAESRGAERLANIRRLLDLARQFDPYQRQGLYRFLRFVRTQEDEELDLEPATVPATDAVRLISVHRSKGLEFPVVALACLGTNFNEQDHGSAVLLDEHLGLSPKITPPGAEQSYASLPHRLARENARRDLRGEELRLLYVAMTRARDTLILVGTTRATESEARWQSSAAPSLETKAILNARSHLDWLCLWLPAVTSDEDWSEQRGENRWLSWEIVPTSDARFAVSAIEPNPALQERIITPPAEAFSSLKARLDWTYPHLAATLETAKTSVTALRRRAADETDDEARPAFRFPSTILAPKNETRTKQKLSAAEIGIAHHTFLQHVEVARTATELDLRNEAQALFNDGLINEAQYQALNFADLAAFWQSAVGSQLRKVAAEALNREMEFTARLAAEDARNLPALGLNPQLASEDFVVVQGQVDLAVILPDEIWLLDFKTDAVDESGIAAKERQYRPQLTAYACALEKIYRRPVTHCWLHFLRARKTLEL